MTVRKVCIYTVSPTGRGRGRGGGPERTNMVSNRRDPSHVWEAALSHHGCAPFLSSPSWPCEPESLESAAQIKACRLNCAVTRSNHAIRRQTSLCLLCLVKTWPSQLCESFFPVIMSQLMPCVDPRDGVVARPCCAQRTRDIWILVKQMHKRRSADSLTHLWFPAIIIISKQHHIKLQFPSTHESILICLGPQLLQSGSGALNFCQGSVKICFCLIGCLKSEAEICCRLKQTKLWDKKTCVRFTWSETVSEMCCNEGYRFCVAFEVWWRNGSRNKDVS